MKARVRIGVQAWLPMHEASGAKTRLFGLLEQAAQLEIARHCEFVLLAPLRTARTSGVHEELGTLAKQFHSARVRETPFAPEPMPKRVLGEKRWLREILSSESIHVLDFGSLPLPSLGSCPFVLTIHDLRDFGPYGRGLLHRSLIRRTLRDAFRRAESLLVPSSLTKRELAKFLPSEGEKLHVVPNGLCTRDYEAPERVPDESLPEAPYFLSLGRNETRKRHRFLLDAYADAAKQDSAVPALVFAGPGDPMSWAELRERVEILRLRERVRFLGPVSEEKKRALLAGARALVFPSALEGFGLPALEAMALGTLPIVAGDSPMAEFAARGALLVAAGSEAWTAALLECTRMDEGALRARGDRLRERSRGYSWRSAARDWLRYLILASKAPLDASLRDELRSLERREISEAREADGRADA